jgi:DNA-binding CsgD family transcriptional regulator
MTEFSIAPVNGEVTSSFDLNIVGAIASWCEALQGQATIVEAMSAVCRSVGADAACVARVTHAEIGESRSICYDKLDVRANAPRLDRSFARAVMGPYLAGARGGSIWCQSLVEVGCDPALDLFQQRRHFGDLIVIPLTVSEKHIDLFELHFSRPLDAVRMDMINKLAPTLSRTWRNRQNGLMTDALLHSKQRDQGAAGLAPILGMDNPAKLSRAEYRVCILLAKGLSNERLLAELDVSYSTLRTHLRSIYAKTETSSRSELLYHLISKTPHMSAADIKVA